MGGEEKLLGSNIESYTKNIYIKKNKSAKMALLSFLIPILIDNNIQDQDVPAYKCIFYNQHRIPQIV